MHRSVSCHRATGRLPSHRQVLQWAPVSGQGCLTSWHSRSAATGIEPAPGHNEQRPRHSAWDLCEDESSAGQHGGVRHVANLVFPAEHQATHRGSQYVALRSCTTKAPARVVPYTSLWSSKPTMLHAGHGCAEGALRSGRVSGPGTRAGLTSGKRNVSGCTAGILLGPGPPSSSLGRGCWRDLSHGMPRLESMLNQLEQLSPLHPAPH